MTKPSPMRTKMSGLRLVVVGSGFGGLAMALRLKAQGAQVTIVERLSDLGGRAQVFKKNGFILSDANSKDYIIGNPGSNPILSLIHI